MPARTAAGPMVIAHRTCPKHQDENSLAGIEVAVEFGADAVEWDTRTTRDVVPVLMHDATPSRTTNGLPFPVAFSSLRRIAGLNHKGNCQPVPTQRQGLELLPSGMWVAIEIKDKRSPAPTLEDIRQAGVADRTMLWAYSEAVVQWYVANAPDIEVSLLRNTKTPVEHLKLLFDAHNLGANGLSISWDAITEPFMQAARDMGMIVYSMWDSKEPADPAKLQLVDGVITDWPVEVLTQLGRKPGPPVRDLS